MEYELKSIQESERSKVEAWRAGYNEQWMRKTNDKSEDWRVKEQQQEDDIVTYSLENYPLQSSHVNT